MPTGWNVSSGSVWSNRLRIMMLTSPRGKRGNRGSWVRLVLQCMVTAPGFGNGDVVITIVAEALGAVSFAFYEKQPLRTKLPIVGSGSPKRSIGISRLSFL